MKLSYEKKDYFVLIPLLKMPNCNQLLKKCLILLVRTQRESWWRLHFMEYPAPAISAVLQEVVDSRTQDHLQRISRRLLPQDIILGTFLGSLNSIHCLIYGSLLSGRIMIIWSKTWMTTFITTKLIKHLFRNLSI